MKRLRLLTFTSLAVLSSCAPPDSALRVNVQVRVQGTARVRADCIRLTVSDDTQELKSVTIKRPADDDAVFAVRKGSDLPGTIKVQATGFLGSDCADETTLKLNAQGELVTGVFPESGVTELQVFLDPPGSALDGDRDGYVSAARGGLDCKDDDNTIFPGAGQVCANTGDTDCDGLSGCDDTECGGAAICADPPDRVQVTTSVTTMLRHECRGPFLVELRNANGPRVAIRDTTVALASSLPGVTVHGVATCTDAPLPSLPIPYGTSSFEVWLKADGQAFGLATLTATAAQVATPGTAMVEVHPQPVDHLAFTTPERTVTAGLCSTEQVTVEFRDSMNRRTDVDSPTTITFASAPGDINNANIFFADPACGTDGSAQQLVPGQGSVSLNLRASRAGSFTLTATPSAGNGITQPLTVAPGTATKLAFTNGPVVLSTTESCSSGRFTVQLQDQFDNPVSAAADVPVRVSVTTLVNVVVFDNTSGCTNASQTDFIIPAGSSSVVLRARGMVASPSVGEIRATVLNGAIVADAVQVLRISAGSASKFRLSGGAQSTLANVCTANPFTVELLDSADNPASSANPVTINLTTSPVADASFRFYRGAGCQTDLAGVVTVPPGETSAQFYFRGNKTLGPFEIRASSSLTGPPAPLTSNFIRAAAPGKLVFVAPLTQSAPAGTCTSNPYRANVLDLFDNPATFSAPQVVTVAGTPAVGSGVTVGEGTCGAGNTVTLAADSSQVSFTAQHLRTGSYALAATVNGFSTPTPATLTVTPGLSTLQVDVPSGGAANLMAGGCQTVTLTRRDSFGNNAPTSGAAAVNLAFTPGTTWAVFASTNCSGTAGAAITMNNTHTVTFSIRPSTSGSQQLTASIPSLSQQVVLTFQVSAGAPGLVFVVPATDAGVATAAQVAGGCSPVTIGRKDLYGNDVPLGTPSSVGFTLAAGTTIHSGTPCVVGAGGNDTSAGIPLTGTDARASFFVRATRSSLTGGPQPQAVIASLASQSVNLTLTVSPATPTLRITSPVNGTANLVAHQCQRVNVERRDAFNNLVPASGTPLTVTPTSGDLQTFVSTDCTGTPNQPITVTAGSSTRDFSLRLDTAGAAARMLNVTLDTQVAPLSLTISPAATAVLVVQGLPVSQVSGACVGPLTVRRRDNYSNDTTAGAVNVAMSSAQFLFSTASNCAGASSSLNVPIADLSSVSSAFYATASLVGMASMTATLPGASGVGSLNVTPGPPAQLVFTTPPRTFLANQCAGAANVITVQLRDAAGNATNAPGGGQAFTVASSSGAGAWFSNLTCTAAVGSGVFTIPAGSNSVSLYYQDTTLGSPNVSLTNGSSLTNPAPQSHTVTVGPPFQLAFTTTARTFTAAECGGAASVITVQLQDSLGNAVNAGTFGQAFTAASNSAGTVTWFTDDTCTTLSGSGSFTIPSGSSSVSLYYRDTRVGTPSISLANTSSLNNPTPQAHTVQAGAPNRLVFTTTIQSIPALSCSGATTVTLQDLGGNVVNAGTNRMITFAATPAGATTTFYSNASCGTLLDPSQLQMSSGSSTVTFYFKAENEGAITLSADSPSLTGATQGANITVAPATQLAFTTPAPTVELGFCQALTIERQDALNRPTITGAITTITPTLAPVAGTALYSNAACTTPLGSTFDIGASASSATVYVKGTVAGLSGVIPANLAYTLTAASAPLTQDSLVITVNPMVRRRSAACTLAAGSIACPITPVLTSIDRTILFFQATPDSDDTASDDNATCKLRVTAGQAEVFCERVGTATNVDIEWQTVSFPYPYASGGVSVQHLSGGCTAAATNTMPVDLAATTAPLANSFVLFSSRSEGADNDGSHFFTAQLTSTTNVRVSQSDASSTCTVTAGFEAQVVSWSGATVTRGLFSGGSGDTFTPSAASVAASPTFLLWTSRMTGDTGGNNNMCRRRLKGTITDTSTLTFIRECTGADIQDIAWELVRLPAGTVQPVGGTTANNGTSISLPLTAVDLTRSFAFIGGQGQGGSASGSTTHSSSDRVGTGLGRTIFTSSTGINFTRSANNSAASWTGYVVELPTP